MTDIVDLLENLYDWTGDISSRIIGYNLKAKYNSEKNCVDVKENGFLKYFIKEEMKKRLRDMAVSDAERYPQAKVSATINEHYIVMGLF